MEGTCNFPTGTNGPSLPLPSQFPSWHGAAQDSRSDAVAPVQHTELRRIERRRAHTATNAEKLTSEPLFGLSSAADTAGHGTGTPTGTVTQEAAARANLSAEQPTSPAAGMAASGSADLETAQVPLVEAAANRKSNYLLKRLATLLRQKQGHSTPVSSFTQRSRFPPTEATGLLSGQQQYWWGHQEQVQRWDDPQQQQHWWKEHLQHVRKHQVQQSNAEKGQGQFDKEHLFEKQKHPQLSREKQDLQYEIMNLAQKKTDAALFQTSAETANVSRQPLHTRQIDTSLRSSCRTMTRTQEQGRRRAQWHEQQQEETAVQGQRREYQQADKKARQGESEQQQQQQRHHQTPSHSLLPVSLQFNAATTHLSEAQHEQEEWQQKRYRQSKQQEVRFRKDRLLPCRCTLPEKDLSETLRQSHEDCTEDQHQQQHAQQDEAERHQDQTQEKEECRMRRIPSQHNQQSPLHPCGKSESIVHRTHAAGARKVLAAAPDREETRKTAAGLTRRMQPVDEKHSHRGAETLVLLAERPSVETADCCNQSTSFPCTAAVAEEKAPPAVAAALRPGACAASVADSVSVGSSGIPTVPGCKPGAAASLAASGEDAYSATAAVPASSDTAVVTRGSNIAGSAGRTGAGAAPRRKQLSGAQKRKRKRELMAKCRVEQASLLSFLATTVTSELILNDWYALESQLRDECAYFERLSSSAWNLPATLSPHSSAAADSSSTVPLSSSDAEDHLTAASDGSQLPVLRFPKLVDGKCLNNIAPAENRQRQDGFHSQQGQQKRQLCAEQLSGVQHPVELQGARLNDDVSSTETTQQQNHSGRERNERGDVSQQMPTTETQSSGSYSCLNEKRTVITKERTPQPPRNLHSSLIVSSFVYNSFACTTASDDRHVESSASGCRNTISKEANNSSKPLTSSPNGDVVSQWGCSPIIHHYEACASNDGRSPLLSGSTTPCSSTHNGTSWEWRTPISSHETATRSSCRTWTDDNEEPIEKDPASSSAIESGEEIPKQIRKTTFAARPETGHSFNSSNVERDMQPHESHVFLPGTVLQPDYVISAADILKKGNSDSERSSNTIITYGSVSSPSCVDTSVEEKDTVGDETGCSDSTKSVDSTRCTTSSKRSDQWKLRGTSDLQQFPERLDAEPSVGSDGRTAESCCLISTTRSIAKDCCRREKGDLESTSSSLSGSERCSGEKSDFQPFSLICPPISNDLLDTGTHDAAASAHPSACVSNILSSAIDGVADPLTRGNVPEGSVRNAAPYGCSLILRSEQQQQQGPLQSRALPVTEDAAKPAVEGQPHRGVQSETPLLIKGDSSTTRYSGEGGKDRVEGGSGSTIRQSLAVTVVETTATGQESVYSQCSNAHGDQIVTSRTEKSNSTCGAATHRMRPSGDTIHFPACWLSSSTPPTPSAQSRRSTSESSSTSEPESLAGLLAACKGHVSSAVADDEASTASSSPAPVLQPPPTPLLCLHPHRDRKRSDSPFPCACLAEAEIVGAASLPACSGRCRLAAHIQELPEPLALPQQLTAQQENVVQQRAVQSQRKQSRPESLTPGHGQPHQQPTIPSEQQQKAAPGLPVQPRQDAHENLLDRCEASTDMHASEGTRLPMIQQQQCSVSEPDTSLYDPALWPAQISDALRISLVRRGPVQIVDFDFPRDATQRRFGRQHYWRTAATGERYWRSWLVYSKSRDAVYCFCCKLYSQLAKSVVSTGFRRWKGAAEVLRSHEQSKDHRTCMLQWKCMCVKVGAEVAFGDLMQLWLPSGLPTASAASLECSPASGSIAGVTAPPVKAADKGETLAALTTETNLHPCLPKRETEAHHGTSPRSRTADVAAGLDVVRGARRMSPCEAVTGDDAAVEEKGIQDRPRARTTEAAGAPTADRSRTGNADHRSAAAAAALWTSRAADAAAPTAKHFLDADTLLGGGRPCKLSRRLDGPSACSSSYGELSHAVLEEHYAGDSSRARWLLPNKKTAPADGTGTAEV